jgi:hypothetical protein
MLVISMSLTILISRDRRTVGIVTWFRDPRGGIAYATGPLVQMSFEEFLESGWEWIRHHFEEYVRVSLPERKATAVFRSNEEKRLLKDYTPVGISWEDSEHLMLIPQVFRKYSLGGLKNLEPETRRTVSQSSPSEAFWRLFDEVLTIAEVSD